MSEKQYDLAVIGGGSGGVRAARLAAENGAKVALIEAQALGGTCVNVGCIPKKLLSYASQFSEIFEYSRGYGWTRSPAQFDWTELIKNKNAEINRLNGIYQNLLKRAQVDIINGHARMLTPTQINVNGQRIKAQKILIATGSRVILPDIPGREHLITSDEVFYLKTQPQRVLVVGGGYIAVEFAGIFQGLGSQTTLIHRGNQLLRGFDHDTVNALTAEMQHQGIDLRLNSELRSVEKTADGLQATLVNGDSLVVDQILCAIGRRPNTDELDLDKLDIALDKQGGIVVDQNFCTNVGSVYALGDVINRVKLTPVAIREATIFVENVFKGHSLEMDYQNIPTAIFSHPNVATVGLSEEQARKTYANITVYESRFRPLLLTLTESEARTYMKLIVDTATDRVVGVHMLGPEAAEIIQGIAIAVKAGLNKAQFDSTIGIHPSMAEEFVTLRTAKKE